MGIGILQHPCQRHSCERRGQAQQIVRREIGSHHHPLALLEVRHGLECEAGKGCEGAAKSHHNQQSPSRIQKHPLCAPNHKEAYDKAASDVDKERAVREDWTDKLCRPAADQPAKIGAEDGADGNDEHIT